MALRVILNGNTREFEELGEGSTLGQLIDHLGLKADRIAIERNGEIVPRNRWPEQTLSSGDKLEIVHFVGGGNGPRPPRAVVNNGPGD